MWWTSIKGVQNQAWLCGKGNPLGIVPGIEIWPYKPNVISTNKNPSLRLRGVKFSGILRYKWISWPQGTGGNRNQWKNEDHLNYSIVEISPNTETSSKNLRRIAVIWSSMKDHQLILARSKLITTKIITFLKYIMERWHTNPWLIQEIGMLKT